MKKGQTISERVTDKDPSSREVSFLVRRSIMVNRNTYCAGFIPLRDRWQWLISARRCQNHKLQAIFVFHGGVKDL